MVVVCAVPRREREREDRMDRMAWALRSLVSQDVALNNAATATAQLMNRRREREDVDAYLAQRLDIPAGSGTTG